ncbi:glycosyltransferase [Vibrio cyclitrophicus]
MKNDRLIVFCLKNNFKKDPVDRLRGGNVIKSLREKGENVEEFNGQRNIDILVTLDYNISTYCKIATYRPKYIVLDMQDDHFTYNAKALNRTRFEKLISLFKIMMRLGLSDFLIKSLYKSANKVTLKKFLSKSKYIIVSSQGLLTKVPFKYQDKTIVIPDGLSSSHNLNETKLKKICWVGTPSNITYLTLVNNALSRICAEYGYRVVIITSKEVFNDKCLLEIISKWDFKFDFVEWDERTVETEISKCSIGIAPLPNGISKSSNKILLYMQQGLATICSGSRDYLELYQKNKSSFLFVDSNNEDAWYEALSSITSNKDKIQDLAKKGKLLSDEFSTDHLALRYINIFDKILS